MRQNHVPDNLFDRFAMLSAADNSGQIVTINPFAAPNSQDQELATKKSVNYCSDCDMAMVLNGAEYVCELCGRVQNFANDMPQSMQRDMRNGNYNQMPRFYSSNSDYPRMQRKLIADQLEAAQLSSPNPFPPQIINAVIVQYNKIQQSLPSDEEKKMGCRKFVRRGQIKDQILAALIHFECIKNGMERKKKDIAAFMKLPSNGFARGEDIIRSLHARGKIDLPVHDDSISGCISRFLANLDIDKPDYRNFIYDLVEESERRNIGLSSQISSKVVGAIWIINCHCGLGISQTTIENKSDNTKKNTFCKFYNLVMRYIDIFAPIFEQYNIPLQPKADLIPVNNSAKNKIKN